MMDKAAYLTARMLAALAQARRSEDPRVRDTHLAFARNYASELNKLKQLPGSEQENLALPSRSAQWL